MSRLSRSPGNHSVVLTIDWSLAAVMCVIVGCSGGQPTQDDQTKLSFPVVVPPEELDLGVLWATDSFVHTIHLKNVSSKDVEIAKLKGSCSCTSVEPSSLTIPPGETRAVNLKLRLSDRSNGDKILDGPNLRTQLIPIISGSSASPPQWKLTGTIRRLLSPSTSFVRFDKPLVQGQPFSFQTVRVVSEVPLRSLVAEGGETFASLDLTKETDTVYDLRIHPHETLPPGPFSFNVALVPCLPSGDKLKGYSLTVEGRVSCEVDLSPRILRWGAARVGQTRESSVMVSSLVGKPFKITSTNVDSVDTQVQVLVEKSSGNGKMLLVKHRIGASGDHTINVAIGVENHEGKNYEITLPISYHGFHNNDKN